MAESLGARFILRFLIISIKIIGIKNAEICIPGATATGK